VLVCGGYDGSNTLDTALIYNCGPAPGKPVQLPPVPATEGMLQAEKAAALKEWLASAEGRLLAENEQVMQAQKDVRQKCDERVARAHEWFDTEVQKLEQDLQQRIASAHALRDQQLERCGAVEQTTAERQITRVRQQAQEAERLAELLESPAAAEASPGPAVNDERPEEHFDMTFSHDVMVDPVLTMCACGTSFEKADLETWLEDHDSCPKCGLKLAAKVVIPNTGLKNMIRDWRPS